MYEWLLKNREWIFSGVGVALLSFILVFCRQIILPNSGSSNRQSGQKQSQQSNNPEINVQVQDVPGQVNITFPSSKNSADINTTELIQSLNDKNKQQEKRINYLQQELQEIKRLLDNYERDVEQLSTISEGNIQFDFSQLVARKSKLEIDISEIIKERNNLSLVLSKVLEVSPSQPSQGSFNEEQVLFYRKLSLDIQERDQKIKSELKKIEKDLELVDSRIDFLSRIISKNIRDSFGLDSYQN